MNLTNLLDNYEEAVAMILFVIGFSNLLLQNNLIKKDYWSEYHGYGDIPVPGAEGIY